MAARVIPHRRSALIASRNSAAAAASTLATVHPFPGAVAALAELGRDCPHLRDADLEPLIVETCAELRRQNLPALDLSRAHLAKSKARAAAMRERLKHIRATRAHADCLAVARDAIALCGMRFHL